MPSTNAPLESQRVSTRAIPPSGSLAGMPQDQGVGNTVIPIFLLAMLIPLRDLSSGTFGLPSFPIPAIVGILLIAVAAFQRSRWQVELPWFTITAGLLITSLIFSSAVTQPDFDIRRAGNYGIVLLLAYVLAGGRLHLDSVRRGLLFGFVVGMAVDVWLLIQGNSPYPGRLSGILGDPNAVGFSLVTLGFIIAQGMQSKRRLVFLWLGMAASIWLTQSRTSMFAFAIATLWVFLGRRFGRVMGLAALIGATWLFQWASEFAEAQGWFQERLGSDNLRDRLEAAEKLMTESAGWWGHGLGTGVAEFDGVTLYFHNSYRALQTEGGLVALTLLILMGVILFSSFYTLPNSNRPVWAEAAVIGACICSFNIGYSLTSVQMATAVGMYLAYHCLAREQLKVEQREESPARS